MLKSLETLLHSPLTTVTTPTTQALDRVYPHTRFSKKKTDIMGFCADRHIEELVCQLLEKAYLAGHWVGISYDSLKNWVQQFIDLEGHLLIEKDLLRHPSCIVKIRLKLEQVLGKDFLRNDRHNRLTEINYALSHLPHNNITMDSIINPNTLDETICRAKTAGLLLLNYPHGEAVIEATSGLLYKLSTHQQSRRAYL